MTKKTIAASAKIMIVEDHPLVQEGLRSVLESTPNFEVVATARTVSEALAQIDTAKPDLVLADLTLPGRSGLELIKDLKAIHPRLPVLVISMHDEDIYAERVLRAGGRGYLMKNSAGKLVIEAIETVLAGGVYVSPETANRFLEALSRGAVKYGLPLQRLTDREIEIFEMIGLGKNSHEIGRLLNISPRTVHAHRNRIREKLSLANSTEVLTHAVKWIESGKAPPC